jgi:hypothetical protein
MNREELVGQAHGLVSRMMRGRRKPGMLAVSFRIKRIIVGASACMLFSALGVAAQGEQSFKGKICLEPDGPTEIWQNSKVMPDCTIARPKRGSKFALFNFENKTVYRINGRTKARDFLGKNVTVIGTFDQAIGTIYADEIFRGISPKIAQAKSVYIECDGCPRGMAVAWRAAFEELSSWGRFEIIPDPKKADLVFLLSANPYLGDYVTRDGPDKRAVKVEITYMNVVDPHTGESLWQDSRQWGSWRVASATKSLIVQLKAELEIEKNAGKS